LTTDNGQKNSHEDFESSWKINFDFILQKQMTLAVLMSSRAVMDDAFRAVGFAIAMMTAVMDLMRLNVRQHNVIR
jgi:hypothetical protein